MPRIMAGPFTFGDVMMRKLQLFPWVIGLLCSPLAAQQRHTITHEDVFLMKRISAPAISPDGRWIVFSVTEPSYTEGEQVSDLWLVATDGSAEPRRLTNTKGGEGGVAWSPDSRRIAFSARREGDDQSQVYVLDLATGGEAQRVTNLSTGAASPLWRPDGKAILFTSLIYPGAATDSANRAAAAERRARSTTRACMTRRRFGCGITGSTTGGRICSCNRSSPARNHEICSWVRSSFKARDSADSSAPAVKISQRRGHPTGAVSCSPLRPIVPTGPMATSSRHSGASARAGVSPNVSRRARTTTTHRNSVRTARRYTPS